MQKCRLLGCKWAHSMRQNTPVRPQKQGGSQRRESDAEFVFVGNGVGSGLGTTVSGKPTGSPLETNLRRGPSRAEMCVSSLDERRRRGAEIRLRLQTIHPNPGPRSGRRTEEAKRIRREKRKLRRIANRERNRERREEERTGRGKEELRVVTWNVQGMSLRGLWKRKVRRRFWWWGGT